MILSKLLFLMLPIPRYKLGERIIFEFSLGGKSLPLFSCMEGGKVCLLQGDP